MPLSSPDPHAHWFRSLLDAAPDPIVGVDDRGVIEFASPRIFDVLGYLPHELIGRSVSMLVPDDRRDRHALYTSAFLLAPGARPMGAGRELHARRKDGSLVQVEISLGHPPQPPGGGTLTVAVIVDVSARRAEERLLAEAQRLEAIGRLAGGIAHDFNNLLTVIRGYAKLAGGRIGDEAPGSAELAEVERAAARAAELTGQLLDVSRQRPTSITPVHLGSLVDGVVPMLERLIGEDIALTVDTADPTPAVLADAHRLEQALLNLVVNARDAMPNGGRLSLRTGTRVITRPDGADAMPAGTYAVLAVSDTGVGMEPAVLAHVFEPFFTTKGNSGTGLGLASVQGVVAQAGGRVLVESEVGAGTTLTILLPRAGHGTPATGGGEPADARRHDVRAPGYETVLVCEDDDAVRKVIVAVLEQAGHVVHEAARPSEALAIAADPRTAIDAIVTDVVLPEHPGPRLVERLQAMRGPVPAVFVSGYTADVIRDRATLPDNSAFLEKPFAPAELLHTLRTVLDERRAHV